MTGHPVPEGYVFDGPASSGLSASGGITLEIYRHPSGSTYRRRSRVGGTVPLREWFEDSKGRAHREGGLPAAVSRCEDGSICEEEWFVDGKSSRLDGPARVTENGRWWLVRNMHLTPSELSEVLYLLEPEEVEREVECSVFAPLLDEGMTAAEVIDAVSRGVRTLEGIREMLGGAPLEWVRAFELGATR